jgi:hypothetical protein
MRGGKNRKGTPAGSWKAGHFSTKIITPVDLHQQAISASVLNI